MEIGGAEIEMNDCLIINDGELTIDNEGLVYLAITNDCSLQEGQSFTVVLSASNSEVLAGDDFIGKHVRSNALLTELRYTKLEGDEYGEYNGKYAITGILLENPNLMVPEPSTWALLILGVTGLMYVRKRKN